jgi:hypothetical protein
MPTLWEKQAAARIHKDEPTPAAKPAAKAPAKKAPAKKPAAAKK